MSTWDIVQAMFKRATCQVENDGRRKKLEFIHGMSSLV